MSYKLQLDSCTNTLHIHSDVCTNLYRTPIYRPYLSHTTYYLSHTTYYLYLCAIQTLLCILTNLYRSRLCDIPNTYFLCILTKRCLHLYVHLLHICNRTQTPSFLSLNFYFLLLHFLLFCNINVLHIL